MADQGDAHTLVVIAIFCIAMSVMSTCMVSMFVSGSSDYDYDTINAYRSDLTSFSGGQLVNDTPWVLNGVYTPFTPGSIPDEDIPDHIERDGGRTTGWLFGQKITNYPYLGEVADIKLDKNQKSNQLLTVGNPTEYEYRNGKSWWNGGNEWGVTVLDPSLVRWFSQTTGIGDIDENYGYETVSGAANNWNYTGYRYTFDPVLPFSSQASAKDGRLSLVWYQIPGDTGLSGALEIYADKDHEQIKLGSISARDIINTFRSSEGYVQTFDFDFEGTHLNLTIRFDPTVYSSYSTLQQAWDDGAWAMAISSASAGNFFDVENSNAFNVTAGSMLDTFVQIYTFEYPHFDNSWMEFIMWILVGLPMTLGMLLITMRLVGGVFKIF
ncbi:MAG: hypothetical protein IIZ78_10505 [Clostridiales bacterium]|nr:hypothetical protein [Clostridiales bacterium]